MTHEELRDRLLDLAYGELAPREAREVEEHAASCEACRAELASIRGTRQVMSALPVEPAPQGPERILVAAAREAARGRAPRRAWPRWLWAAPVVGASLAAVVAVSLRLGPVRPPSAAREDPDALRGESPYAMQAPAAPAAPPPAAAEATPREAPEASAKGAAAARDEARATARKEAPRRAEAERRFATAPDEAPGLAAPSREREAGAAAERNLQRAAPAAPPSVASAAPPAATPPAAAPAPQLRALRPAPGAGATADAAPYAGAVGSFAPAPEQDLGEPGARREAAPSPARRAKAALAPAGEGVSRAVPPADRAVAVALAHARRLGFDTAGLPIEPTDRPLTWEAWRSEPGATPPAALAGRRFWVVVFAPGGPRPPGGALTVFVEDGTFRPLAELRGE
jgi:hypothetical protein